MHRQIHVLNDEPVKRAVPHAFDGRRGELAGVVGKTDLRRRALERRDRQRERGETISELKSHGVIAEVEFLAARFPHVPRNKRLRDLVVRRPHCNAHSSVREQTRNADSRGSSSARISTSVARAHELVGSLAVEIADRRGRSGRSASRVRICHDVRAVGGVDLEVFRKVGRVLHVELREVEIRAQEARRCCCIA